MQIIHHKKFSVLTCLQARSTGISKDRKSLKVPSDSISEGVVFQGFLGSLLRFFTWITIYFTRYKGPYPISVNHASTIIIKLAVPSFQMSRSIPAISNYVILHFGSSNHCNNSVRLHNRRENNQIIYV